MRNRRVRGSAIADVIKVWVWALGSLVVGLWLTPVAFNGGKALSELSASKDFNGVVNKLAAWSGAARLEDFFMICWPLVALFLLLPLVEWLKLGNGRSEKSAWRIRLPHWAATSGENGQAIMPDRWGPMNGLAGFLLTFGCFVIIGVALVRAGSFTWTGSGEGWQDGLWLEVGWALMVAFVIEIFFRRVVLGIFLRAMDVTFAVGSAALMFAGIQLILSGFGNAAKVDGETLSAFHLTGILFTSGDFLQRVVVVFLPWFAFGCVLGWARWRTASLWLPTGLLTGWLLAERLFSKATDAVPIHDKVAKYFAADSVHTGIIPLLGVIAVAGFVHIFTQGQALKRNSSECD